MIVPRLASLHPVDVERRYDVAVAELVSAFQALRAAHEQLKAKTDDLLNVTPASRETGLLLVCELDEMLRARP